MAVATIGASIIEAIREPFLVLSSDLTVLAANASFCRTFGISSEKTTGSRIYDVGNGLWNIPHLRRLLEDALPHNQEVDDYLVEHDFDGIGRRIMLLTARRIDHEQVILLGIEDVTNRKRAEQALLESHERCRVLLESMSQALWETDAAGVVTGDSESWRAYTGQTRDEWFREGWLSAVHPDDREQAEVEWRNALLTGRGIALEIRLRSPDGRWRWTRMQAAPSRNSQGQIVKWFGMNLDIGRRKQAEIERELLTRELSHRVNNTFAVPGAFTNL